MLHLLTSSYIILYDSQQFILMLHTSIPYKGDPERIFSMSMLCLQQDTISLLKYRNNLVMHSSWRRWEESSPMNRIMCITYMSCEQRSSSLSSERIAKQGSTKSFKNGIFDSATSISFISSFKTSLNGLVYKDWARSRISKMCCMLIFLNWLCIAHKISSKTE